MMGLGKAKCDSSSLTCSTPAGWPKLCLNEEVTQPSRRKGQSVRGLPAAHATMIKFGFARLRCNLACSPSVLTF